MGEGFNLRTMKFGRQISPGLVLPISTFSEINGEIELGQDVSDLFKVKKWEIEERVTTDEAIIVILPIDLPYTDETRIPTEPGLLKEFADIEYYISSKMDGTFCFIDIGDEGIHVTGQNCEYKDNDLCDFYIDAKKMVIYR